MDATSQLIDRSGARGYCHEAFLYRGLDEFLGGAVAFIRQGLAAGEAVLVALPSAKLGALRAVLGRWAGSPHVSFGDMSAIGCNPARIIPAWRAFVDQHAGTGRALRVVGEPVWPDRSDDELVECHRHEALANIALADTDLWLLCLYDVDALGPAIAHEVRRTHPLVHEDGTCAPSPAYASDVALVTWDEPLPAAPRDTPALRFREHDLPTIRHFIVHHATRAGLTGERAFDLVTAANEVATNSIAHGGESGLLRVWRRGRSFICDVQDPGHIRDPLAGRVRPSVLGGGGRGLWLANQLCDLVQIRSGERGSTVRLHMTV